MNAGVPWPDKANKRTASQKEADAVFIEERILEGQPYGEIAVQLSAERPYTLSKSQVYADARKIEARWRERSQDLVDTSKGRHLASLDALTREAWGAWRKSGGQDTATLRLVLDIERQRARVWGLDNPPSKIDGFAANLPPPRLILTVNDPLAHLSWEEKVKRTTGVDVAPMSD